MNLDTKLADHVQPTDISSHAREMADRVSREYDDRMQQSMASHQKTVHEALEHGRAELRSVVGPQLWPVWRRLMWREQLAWRERMQPPEGPFRDLAADLRSRKEGIAKFLDGTGVSLERIRQIADNRPDAETSPHAGHAPGVRLSAGRPRRQAA